MCADRFENYVGLFFRVVIEADDFAFDARRSFRRRYAFGGADGRIVERAHAARLLDDGHASYATDTPRVVSFQPWQTAVLAPGRPPATARKSRLGSWMVFTK